MKSCETAAKPPPVGGFVRILKETFGFRISDIYAQICVPVGSLCIVTQHGGVVGDRNEFNTKGFSTTLLKYVKCRNRWEETKVMVDLMWGEMFYPLTWEPVDPATL